MLVTPPVNSCFTSPSGRILKLFRSSLVFTTHQTGCWNPLVFQKVALQLTLVVPPLTRGHSLLGLALASILGNAHKEPTTEWGELWSSQTFYWAQLAGPQFLLIFLSASFPNSSKSWRFCLSTLGAEENEASPAAVTYARLLCPLTAIAHWAG